MEFIRKINRTEMVAGSRWEMVDFEEEQTHEVFVVELSRQEVEDLIAVYRRLDGMGYQWFRKLRHKMEFVLDLKRCFT